MKNPWNDGLAWPTIVWFALIHVGALAAPFYFSWSSLAVMIFLCWFTGCIGITLGYHRCLTHRSFETYPWVRRILAFIGGLAGEGTALAWVAAHRKHHQFSDQEGDPHSPRDGFWWSHLLWMLPKEGMAGNKRMIAKYAPDLMGDPWMVMLHSNFLVYQALLGLLLFVCGGWSWFLWGFCLRMFLVLHGTWFINSVTHKYGYRNYETRDDSTNFWPLALITWGESWHNNHHALPRVANHGHRWWEFDVTNWVICFLEKIGLAWKVVRQYE